MYNTNGFFGVNAGNTIYSVTTTGLTGSTFSGAIAVNQTANYLVLGYGPKIYYCSTGASLTTKANGQTATFTAISDTTTTRTYIDLALTSDGQVLLAATATNVYQTTFSSTNYGILTSVFTGTAITSMKVTSDGLYLAVIDSNTVYWAYRSTTSASFSAGTAITATTQMGTSFAIAFFNSSINTAINAAIIAVTNTGTFVSFAPWNGSGFSNFIDSTGTFTTGVSFAPTRLVVTLDSLIFYNKTSSHLFKFIYAAVPAVSNFTASYPISTALTIPYTSSLTTSLSLTGLVKSSNYTISLTASNAVGSSQTVTTSFTPA
jgi:hypothetical protein